MSEKVYCNVCLRETRMMADPQVGCWICMCCGRHLWPLDKTFALGK